MDENLKSFGVEPMRKPLDFHKYLVDFTKPAPEPQFLLSIDNTPFLPAGSICAVTGVAKQGKTQWLAAMVATIIGGRNFGRLKRLQPTGNVLWIDTEQSAFHIHKTIERVYKLAGIPQGEASAAHGLQVMAVAALNPDERLEVVSAAVKEYRPAVLVIDGIRDLLHNFNSEDETETLTTWLYQLIEDNPELRILSVLHTNPSGDKMRGHLGTELNNKFTDKFICSKDNGFFSVRHECRGREILNPFIFRINEAGELEPSTNEEASGAVVAGDDALGIILAGGVGKEFDDLVKAYGNLAGVKQKVARSILIEKLNATPPILERRRDGLFYLVDEPRPGEQDVFTTTEDNAPY